MSDFNYVFVIICSDNDFFYKIHEMSRILGTFKMV